MRYFYLKNSTLDIFISGISGWILFSQGYQVGYFISEISGWILLTQIENEILIVSFRSDKVKNWDRTRLKASLVELYIIF